MCHPLLIFPVENKEYIALLPLDENGQNGDRWGFISTASPAHSRRRSDAGKLEDDEVSTMLPQMPLTQSWKKHVQTRRRTHPLS